jgi:hypothetical protein
MTEHQARRCSTDHAAIISEALRARCRRRVPYGASSDQAVIDAIPSVELDSALRPVGEIAVVRVDGQQRIPISGILSTHGFPLELALERVDGRLILNRGRGGVTRRLDERGRLTLPRPWANALGLVAGVQCVVARIDTDSVVVVPGDRVRVA